MEMLSILNKTRIRKTWLWMALANYFLIPSIGFLGVAAMLLEAPPLDNAMSEVILPLILGYVQGAIIFSILYACAYKKGGRNMLTWFLCIAPFGIFKDLYDSYNAALETQETWMIFVLFLEVLVYFAFYLQSIQLWRVNRQIYLDTIHQSSEYQEAMTKFKSSSTLDELNLLFGNLLREKDHVEFYGEAALNEAYKSRKKALLTTKNSVPKIPATQIT